ncbi:MAG: HEAT repeat domain-containing protein, partial [Planctomycetota bacterium]
MRLPSVRRAACALLLAALAGCRSGDRKTTQVTPVPRLPKEVSERESTKLVLRTKRNIAMWQELKDQGKPTQARSLRSAIAGEVDRQFDDFLSVAREGEVLQLRSPAVMALGFAQERRDAARDALLGFLEDPSAYIVQNALRALGVLAHPETDLTVLIRMVGHGDPVARANAADALGVLFYQRATPRELTQEYRVAIERLGTLLVDRTNTPGRRAAAGALGNIHHPDVLELLVLALKDEDETVQIAALAGLRELADPRSLETLFAFLDDTSNDAAASWAREALARIAV